MPLCGESPEKLLLVLLIDGVPITPLEVDPAEGDMLAQLFIATGFHFVCTNLVANSEIE
jgi:hypothetical protein